MCAIAGYWGNGNQKKLLSMLEAISHRGPDGRGVYIDKEVGLGHNRLSIIDLSSKGYQPMSDDEKKFYIVLNGEIYNYRELRRKLLKEFKFRSQTDTEVLLYAYKKWGVGCLEKLNGMFAFVIYDKPKNLFFGARDRIGEKPLKYYLDSNLFAFASEVKALLPILPNQPEIDSEAIDLYLTFGYVPAPKTGLKGIYKLPPGSFFIYRKGKLIIRKYWQLDFSKKINLTQGEVEEVLFEQINNAVRERMHSDVPLGAFLSGGIDSSSVVAFMAKNSVKPIKTFNIGFGDAEFDETQFAKIVAEKYQTEHHTLMVNKKMIFDALDNFVSFWDEPFADHSALPTVILAKYAKQKMSAALSGDGGDENFAGYLRYKVLKLGKIYGKTPLVLRELILKEIANLVFKVYPNNFTLKIKTFVDTYKMPFYKKYIYYAFFINPDLKQKLYSQGFKMGLKVSSVFEPIKNLYQKGLDDPDNALNFDINSYLAEDLLHKMDTASMSFGLEVRSPLLDYRLMELTASLSNNLKIRNFSSKYIFKSMLLKKNILPKQIIYRKKKGFVANMSKLLKKDLNRTAKEQILCSKLMSFGIFNPKLLEDYLNKYPSSRVDYSNNIFAILFLAKWIDEYC